MLGRILRAIVSGYTKVEKGASITAAWVILFLMFLTSADVIGRHFFGKPIQTVYEISQNLLLVIVYLSIAYVASIRGHPKVDIVTSWLPWRGQLAIDIFGYVAGLTIMGIVTWQTGIRAWTSWVVQDYSMGLIDLPLWPGKFILPIGIGMLCIRLIIIIVEDISYLSRGVPPKEFEQIID